VVGAAAAAAAADAGGDDDSFMTKGHRAQFQCTKQVLNPAESSPTPQAQLLRGARGLADTVQKTHNVTQRKDCGQSQQRIGIKNNTPPP
jgi:hypothetical protein